MGLYSGKIAYNKPRLVTESETWKMIPHYFQVIRLQKRGYNKKNWSRHRSQITDRRSQITCHRSQVTGHMSQYLRNVFNVNAATERVREGDDLEIGVNLRDFLEPFHARAARLQRVGAQRLRWHMRNDAAPRASPSAPPVPPPVFATTLASPVGYFSGHDAITTASFQARAFWAPHRRHAPNDLRPSWHLRRGKNSIAKWTMCIYNSSAELVQSRVPFNCAPYHTSNPSRGRAQRRQTWAELAGGAGRSVVATFRLPAFALNRRRLDSCYPCQVEARSNRRASRAVCRAAMCFTAPPNHRYSRR